MEDNLQLTVPQTLGLGKIVRFLLQRYDRLRRKADSGSLTSR